MDWRKNVSQSRRSEQIREISKVLSSLEPGSTPTEKLMLSMRFEDQVFKTSKSLDDYQRKLVKRLTKLQASYKPPSAATAKASVQDETDGGVRADKLRREILDKYGKSIKFVLEKSGKAVEALRSKGRQREADVLSVHVDNVGQNAVNLGLVPESHVFRHHGNGVTKKFRKTVLPTHAHAHAHTHAQALESILAGYNSARLFLEERLDNIRQHILKHSDENLFLQEEWIKLERNLDDTLCARLSEAVQQPSTKSSSSSPSPADLAREVTRWSEQALMPVPAPNRRDHDASVVRARLLHVRRIRAAIRALLAYFSFPTQEQTRPFEGLPKRMHMVAVEGLAFLTECSNKASSFSDQNNNGKSSSDPPDTATTGTLEDTWRRPLVYHAVNVNVNVNDTKDHNDDTGDDSIGGEEPARKRARTTAKMVAHPPPLMVKTRVLLQPGRAVPSHVLRALTEKKVKLVRSSNDAACAACHIRMDFPSSATKPGSGAGAGGFRIHVHCNPLLVRFVGIHQEDDNDENGNDNGSRKFLHTVVHGGLPSWHDRSYDFDALTGPGAGPGASAGPYPTTGVVTGSDATEHHHHHQQHLEYASARATFVLRRCFTDMTCKASSADDVGIEILETSALMKFILLVRETYTNTKTNNDSGSRAS